MALFYGFLIGVGFIIFVYPLIPLFITDYAPKRAG